MVASRIMPAKGKDAEAWMDFTHDGKRVKIMFLPFPVEACGGFLTDCGEHWLIGINCDRCALLQRHSLGHELAHLFLGHLDDDQRGRPIREVEAEADVLAWSFYRAYRDGTLPGEMNCREEVIPCHT